MSARAAIASCVGTRRTESAALAASAHGLGCTLGTTTRVWRLRLPRPVRTLTRAADDRRWLDGGVATRRNDRPRPESYDFPPSPASGGPQGPPPPPRPQGPEGGGGGFNGFTRALVAGSFVMGMGAGVWFSSEANFEPSNVASTAIIDRRTPNAELCMSYGSSAMVFDERVFVSFNPFNVYVTQPEVKPGCVLKRSNVNQLEKRSLVTDKQVMSCKNRMNTFAFVGDIDGSPELSCVYHSEDAENQFLRDPRHAVLGDGVVQGRLQGQGRGGSQGGEGSSGGGDGLTLE